MSNSLILYLNFRAVLAQPKTAGSAQTHNSMSFIGIVWSTLYVYLCLFPHNYYKAEFLITSPPSLRFFFSFCRKAGLP